VADEGATTAATLIAKFKGDDSDVMQAIRRVRAAAIELGAIDTTVDVEAKGAAKAIADMEAVKAAADRLDTSDERLFTTQRKLNNENGTSLKRWQAITLGVFALLPLLGPLAGYSAAVAGGFTAMGFAGIAAIFGIRREMQQGTAAGATYAAGIQLLKGDLNELGHTAAVAMLESYERVIGLVQARMPQLNADTRVFAGVLGATGTAIVSGVLASMQALTPLLVTGAVYVERIAFGFQQWANGGGVEKFANYALNVLPQVASTIGQLAKLILDVVTAAAPWGTVVLGALDVVARFLDAFPLPVLGAIAAGAIAGYGAFRLWNGISGGIEAVKAAVAAVSTAIQAHIPLTQAEIDLSATYTALLSTQAGVLEAVATGEKEAAAGATAMDVAMDANPIGVVAAALGALAAIAAVVVGSTNSATDATNDYTAAVQQDNGVIGEHIRLQTAKNLADSGSVKTNKELGLSLNTLTAAALGNESAQRKVTDAVKKKTDALDKDLQSNRAGASGLRALSFAQESQRKELSTYTDTVNGNAAAVKKAISAYNEQQKLLGGVTISTKAQLQAQQDLANRYGLSLSDFVNATAAQKKQADQAAEVTHELQRESDAATLLSNALDVLNGGSLDVAQAQTGLAAANNSTTDSFRQNGLAIDGNSKQAVANQQAIQASVQSAQQYAEAIGKQTGSSEKARQALIDSKTQLENNLRSQGALTGAVQAYIDKIFQIPKSIPPTKIDVDAKVAQAKLAALQRQLDALSHGYTLILNASGKAEGRVILGGSAGKNGAQAHAGGGTVFGPGTSTSDSVPMWASVGEEYIKASSAQKVRPLLKAINKDPERAVQSVMAAGAMAAPQVEKHEHLHVDGYGLSVDGLFREFQRRITAESNAIEA
jgi:hypothetical protein